MQNPDNNPEQTASSTPFPQAPETNHTPMTTPIDTTTRPSTVKPEPESTNIKPMPVQTSDDNFALISLVLGILSLCASIIPICGILFGTIALVLGIKGNSSPQKATMAKIGIALAILGILGSILWAIFSTALSFLPETFTSL